MEIKIKIDAPGLETAISDLAQALRESDRVESWVPGGGEVRIPPAEASTEKAEAKKEDKPEKDTAEVETKATEGPKPNKDTSGISLQNVKDVLVNFSRQGRQPELKEIISSFGAEKLTDVPEDKYAELIEKAEALL